MDGREATILFLYLRGVPYREQCKAFLWVQPSGTGKIQIANADSFSYSKRFNIYTCYQTKFQSRMDACRQLMRMSHHISPLTTTLHRFSNKFLQISVMSNPIGRKCGFFNLPRKSHDMSRVKLFISSMDK